LGCGEVLEEKLRHHGLQNPCIRYAFFQGLEQKEKMAGVAGFEPTHDGIRIKHILPSSAAKVQEN
jgi:hypothetical protein